MCVEIAAFKEELRSISVKTRGDGDTEGVFRKGGMVLML